MYHFRRCLIVLGCLCPLTPSLVLAAFPRPTHSENGMVVSAHPLATQAGVKMFKQGGNAIDAAVATTLAISVVEPFAAGIGGGGFLVTKVGKEITALDFRERAPQKSFRNMYLDAQGKVRGNRSLEGHLAAGVPGTIAGLAAAHKKYGKLPWRAVVQPAIELAQQGFIVSEIYTSQAKLKQKLLANNAAARQIFTRNGQPLQPGDRLIQHDLARTLTAIAQNPQTFYRGWIAQAIERDMRRNGGLITLPDLKSYQPKWRTPLCGNFRQYRVCAMPPPSSGGVHLLQILNTIGNTNLADRGWHNPDTLHLLIESMRIAYADRSQYLGDPDFVKVPVTALTNPDYAAFRRQEISSDRARPSTLVKPIQPEVLERFNQPEKPIAPPILKKSELWHPSEPNIQQFNHKLYPYPSSTDHKKTKQQLSRLPTNNSMQGGLGGGILPPLGWFGDRNPQVRVLTTPTTSKPQNNHPTIPAESNDTSHITVVDKQRHVVSLTFTVNYRFGAGVVVPGTGILLNDQMDDFAIAPGVPNVFGLVGGDANSIAPGKTPLSSMTPTIVTENGKFRLALGSPGGSTIITTVLQILLNVLEYKMDVGSAVAAGRFHHQWLPDRVDIEAWDFDSPTLAELRRRGHKIEAREVWGNANAIQQLPDGRLEGAADPRGEGAARGF